MFNTTPDDRFIVLYETRHFLNGDHSGVVYTSDVVPFPDPELADSYAKGLHAGRWDKFPSEYKLGVIRDGHLEALINPQTHDTVSEDPHLMHVIASHIGLEEASDK